MDYERKYHKYKDKYLKLKSKLQREYVNLGISQDYLLKLFEERGLKDVDILEVGIGNPSNGSMELAERFAKTYTALEPNTEFYNIGLEICKENNCKIKFVNTSLEDFKTVDKYDIILFKNSIHFINISDAIKIFRKITKPTSLIVISHPKKANPDSTKKRTGYVFTPDAISDINNTLTRTRNIILGGIYGHYKVDEHKETDKVDFIVLSKK